MRITALALLDGDDTVLRNLTHSISQQLTNLSVVVGTDSSHLLNLVVVVTNLLSTLLNVCNDSLYSLVNTTLQVHGISTCRHVLQTL